MWLWLLADIATPLQFMLLAPLSILRSWLGLDVRLLFGHLFLQALELSLSVVIIGKQTV